MTEVNGFLYRFTLFKWKLNSVRLGSLLAEAEPRLLGAKYRCSCSCVVVHGQGKKGKVVGHMMQNKSLYRYLSSGFHHWASIGL